MQEVLGTKKSFGIIRELKRLYERAGVHLREVIHGTLSASFLKLLAGGITFCLNVVVARTLGAKGAGLFFLAVTVITVGASIGRFGLTNIVVRVIASNAAEGNWSAVNGYYGKSMLIAGISSISVGILTIAVAPLMAKRLFSDGGLTYLLQSLALGLLPITLYGLHAQALQGIKRISDAILILNVWMPVFTILGILVLAPIYGIIGAAWAYLFAAIITLSIGRWRWLKAMRGMDNGRGTYSARSLLNDAFPLLWVEILNLSASWAPIILLGYYSTSTEVGLYVTASRTAQLASFVLIAANSILAPKFAELYAGGQIGSLERTVRASAKLMSLIAIPIVGIFLAFPERILSVFGGSFTSGAAALSVLSIGQFLNVATGSVGQLLIMTRNERLLRVSAGLGLAVVLSINMLLIPKYGILGAAIATAVGLSLQNLTEAFFAWQRVGIMTIPISSRIMDFFLRASSEK